MSSLITFFKARPLGAIVALAVLVALCFGGYRAGRSKLYDRSDAKHEKEKAALRAERDAAVLRANDAESRALLLEAKEAETDALIAAKGGEIQKAEARLDKQIEEAKRGAGDCTRVDDPAERRRCLCAKLAAAGFPCG